jgi:hypothetical protein
VDIEPATATNGVEILAVEGDYPITSRWSDDRHLELSLPLGAKRILRMQPEAGDIKVTIK